jgi:hypothetical protein
MCGNNALEHWRQADFVAVGKLFARRLGGKADHIVVEDAGCWKGPGRGNGEVVGCGCGCGRAGRAGQGRTGQTDAVRSSPVQNVRGRGVEGSKGRTVEGSASDATSTPMARFSYSSLSLAT